MVEARDAATRRVVESDHRLRVIVAGPGTGKSYAFKLALLRKGGAGLALTFIKSLAGELALDLGESAATYTFHSYSKHLLHQFGPAGLTRDFTLYPPLFALMTIDLGLLGSGQPTTGLTERQLDDLKSSVERTFQDLDPTSAVPSTVLALGTYYDAASFVDLVYRVFRHLEANPDDTPAYPLVVVDEYQDFSRLETAFIAQLGLKSPLLIAGDDDQALYGFRHASAEHIRNLAVLKEVERHVLPFCSRCTQAVVAAVNTTIAHAVASGRLQGRLEKPFECYLPDKAVDSKQYPKLIDARCTIHRYMAEYVANEIGKISQADIDVSIKGRYPTVLVVGPGQFVKPIYQHLSQGDYPEAELRASERLAVAPFDGYRLLGADPMSNLGWRILIHLYPFAGWQKVVLEALQRGESLASLLPAAWKSDRLVTADLLRRARRGEALDPSEFGDLAAELKLDKEDLDELLTRDATVEKKEGDPEALPSELQEPTDAPARPAILCTTLKGAKGLSAQHVFIVGLMNGHLPRETDPTDEEVCEFLVALSRTRKACHLVSTKIFAGPPALRPSMFLSWVKSQCSDVTVDKAYWAQRR